MAGNKLGSRSYYLYTDDLGNNYSYLTDDDLATAVSATLDDSNPPFPRRFKPRGVYVEDAAGARKFVICPLTTTVQYASNASQAVTIDTVAFSTTGRKGEQQSFGSN